MVRHSSNRHKPISAQADTLANDASDLYVRSYSKGEIDQTALREALIKAKRALVLAPGDYHNLILVARIFSDFNDQQSHAQSLKYYERAIALRPDLPVAYEEKAQFLMDWLDPPDPAEAERLARKALKLSIHDDEDPETLALTFSTLIGILEARRKFDEGRRIIRQALRKCPTELMHELAEATLKRIGNPTTSRVPRAQ